MKATSLWAGFLVGGIAAGIATILTAPATGEESRHRLKESKGEMERKLHEIKSGLDEIKNTVTKLSTEGKVVVTDFIQDVKILIKAWQKDIAPHQHQLKNEIHSLQKTLEQLEESIDHNALH